MAKEKLFETVKILYNLGNILNLCCAVATSEAEWVHENRVG
jgi:hypothetical protein